MRAAAFLTRAQVDPLAADRHAFVALVPGWLFDRGDRTYVSAALVWH